VPEDEEWEYEEEDPQPDHDEAEEPPDESRSSDRRSSNNDDDLKGRGNAGPPPKFCGSKDATIFENWHIKTSMWLAATNLRGSARGPRILQELPDKVFEEVKHLGKDKEWLADANNGQLLLDILNDEDHYGMEGYVDLYTSMKKLIYDPLKTPGDDIAALVSKVDNANRKVQGNGIKFPPEAVGFFLLYHLDLDEDALDRVIQMTSGDLRYNTIIKAMKKRELRLHAPGKHPKKSTQAWQAGLEQDDLGPPPMVIDDEDEEVQALMSALSELDDHGAVAGDPVEITEDEAREILMSMVRNKSSTSVQKMGYQELKKTKANIRTGRGFRDGQQGPTKDLSYLKSVTKCKKCLGKGHWHKDAACPMNQGRNAGAIHRQPVRRS
jgi:hypothetical protein